ANPQIPYFFHPCISVNSVANKFFPWPPWCRPEKRSAFRRDGFNGGPGEQVTGHDGD
ncbi:MAG: hypothetical protein ACI9KN_000257, partial [Gammaproteobacteria bacterium]